MIEVNNRVKARVKTELIITTVKKFLKYYRRRESEVSIAIVGDAEIRRINRATLGSDAVTDVIAFPGEADYLGEIIIDLAETKRQSKTYGHPVEAELAFVLIHGLLHLSGYDDKTVKGKEKMLKLGQKLLNIFYREK